MNKKIYIVIGIVLFLALTFFAFWRKVEKEAFLGVAGTSSEGVDFEAKEGDGSTEVGENLAKEGLIKNKYYFYYYVWKTDTANKIQAGIYELAPNMTIGEMVEKFTAGEVKSKILKLTVPEGFTNKKIIELLKNKRPSIVDEFEEIVMCQCLNQPDCACDRFSEKYYFLGEIPRGVDMEGYLFPDTYFIDTEETGVTLASKFLNNFERKMADDLRAEIERSEYSLHQIITMASIVEREAKTDQDRKLVSGIFWQRLKDSHPLQSCATLAYFLGVDKIQFSNNDTQVVSPYNTYLNPSLPPGPIANPGLKAIEAAVRPTESDYYYFLSDPETGEIFYARTNEEHARNKSEHGL